MKLSEKAYYCGLMLVNLYLSLDGGTEHISAGFFWISAVMITLAYWIVKTIKELTQ